MNYFILQKYVLPILFFTEDAKARKMSTVTIAAICAVCAAAAILLCLAFIIWRKMRRRILRDARIVHINNDVARLEAVKPPNATTVTSIDLATLEKATQKFSERNKIGEGAFGVVYEVRKQLIKFHLFTLSPSTMMVRI